MTSWKEYSQKKVISPEKLEATIRVLRGKKKSIATLNGSFDLLQAGHLYILFEASKTADVLIVALNSDASIKSYKGSDRPIISLPFRLEMLTSISFVDYVTWFDQTDPCAILEIIKPDVHVNGIEYGENCIEAETVKRGGGRLHLVDLIEGLSTSKIIKKIQGIGHSCV